MRSLGAGFLFLLAILLAACGGGSGGGDSGGGGGGSGSAAGTTTFSGGSLADLQALNSGLSFDNLVITGALRLPINAATTIRANNLTISATGSITYTYTTCQWLPAPDLTLTVSQSATIAGTINLDGRFGTTVTGGASCNSCTGAPGGNIILTANTIAVDGTLTNDGGGGASFRDSFGSSPCSSGASGDLQLAAVASMNLSGATITNNTGVNFAGQSGSSGTALVTVQNGMLTMVNGSLRTTGALTLRASSTNIFGPITYGSISETIGGSADSSGPTVSVLTPASGAGLQLGDTVNVQVQASDAGTGFKEVRITGLGHDQTYTASQFSGSTLSVPITVPDVTSPATLTIVGKDNKGNTNTQTVTGLQITIPPETEPNDSVAGAVQLLAKDAPLRGTIQNNDAFSIPAITSGGGAMFTNNYSSQARVEDFYRVRCCDIVGTARRLTIVVDFSADAALAPDIDVYVLNAAGSQVVARSTLANNSANGFVETVVAGGAVNTSTNFVQFTSANDNQEFIVAVQAWNVPQRTRYTIKRD